MKFKIVKSNNAVTTYLVFNNTFALFESDASGVVNSQIGRWIIKISNETITDGTNEDINISNFVYASNPRVASGVIAPGTSAYFDLVFDVRCLPNPFYVEGLREKTGRAARGYRDPQCKSGFPGHPAGVNPCCAWERDPRTDPGS